MGHRRDGRRGDDAAYPVFVRFGGASASSGETVVSRQALRLHVYAVLASIEAGCPGRVTDEYLDAVAAATSVDAVELCTAGLWARDGDGYDVVESEVMRMASEVHRQLEDLTAWCRRTGGHEPDTEYPGFCRKCAVRLEQPMS
ncbi:MAG TPA: hypothetical protein VGH43_18940 [Jatrophihabitans sp.]|jgi:hypothetical protein